MMSLKCEATNCPNWVDYECSCEQKMRLCDKHFRQHGELYGCFANSIRNNVYEKVFHMRQAVKSLIDARNDIMLIVEKMMNELQLLLIQITQDIGKRKKILKDWICKGVAGDIESVMGNYRFADLKKRNADDFIETVRSMLNMRMFNEFGRVRNTGLGENMGNRYLAPQYFSYEQIQEFSSLDLKERICKIENLGISLQDVKKDIFDVKISKDKGFALVCII
ncbi:hypothetical protein SteCoe_7820 [Stentor coeruleus]|uniref:Uncharacterized protein n=1 Tax=Stentor coeruleus TaxID=5963 RepID=A0A1R2CLR7_9CILI|nr:hypothetical protein SteCoe_7820 [Stentor coeruleus]